VVALALERLGQAHLLESRPARSAAAPRMTRRSILSKMKVAAALLPVVATILAPTASAAASYLTDAQCASRGTNSVSCTKQPRKCTDIGTGYRACRSTKTKKACGCK
jgi:hypothetical protein